MKACKIGEIDLFQLDGQTLCLGFAPWPATGEENTNRLVGKKTDALKSKKAYKY
jgi:hypothetical protein